MQEKSFLEVMRLAAKGDPEAQRLLKPLQSIRDKFLGIQRDSLSGMTLESFFEGTSDKEFEKWFSKIPVSPQTLQAIAAGAGWASARFDAVVRAMIKENKALRTELQNTTSKPSQSSKARLKKNITRDTLVDAIKTIPKRNGKPNKEAIARKVGLKDGSSLPKYLKKYNLRLE